MKRIYKRLTVTCPFCGVEFEAFSCDLDALCPHCSELIQIDEEIHLIRRGPSYPREREERPQRATL